MESVTFSAGTTIIREGETIDRILIISSGSITGSSVKGNIFLQKGDIPGIFDLFCGYSFYTYTASEAVTCLSYPLTGKDALLSFLRSRAELSTLFAATICRQCCNILDDSLLQDYNCDRFYTGIKDNYRDYIALCTRHGITPKHLSEIEELSPFSTEDMLPEYLSAYYETLRSLSPDICTSLFQKHPDFTYGFLQKAADDIHLVLEHLQMLADYQADSSYLLLNTNNTDLFDLYTSLCYQLQKQQIDTMSLQATISKLMIQMEGQRAIDHTLYQARVGEYRRQLNDLAIQMEHPDKAPSTEAFPQELHNSVHTILQYADYDESSEKLFLADLASYRALKDRSSLDDSVISLRKRLTQAFYEIYTAVFQYSLKDPTPPLAVRLFLLFGYMDEDLAGVENTLALSRIAKSLTDQTAHGVFTLYDWLLAIYYGKREPSRNEFDNDYTQYLHDLRFSGKITPEDEVRLRADPASRVMFELQNMFPIVNKITCGHLASFCPVFSEHNCLRIPEESLVTLEKIQNTLNLVRSIDYSVFYREVLFALPEASIPHETIQAEVLPDFVLMPNIGIRSVLWQEIEGKRRTTPGRMMLPILCQDDLTMLLIHLCGEFRWEMCKRMQGAHWNDISDPSLTSEYFDYIQFFRKNNELSPDAKEKLKLGLQRAKNSYREMFVRDYIQWIYYEAAGSPRLNKVVRRILFRYCPFSAAYRERLGNNPLYKEVLDRYRIRNAHDKHHLQNVMVKIQNAGKPIPQELKQQMEYLNL